MSEPVVTSATSPANSLTRSMLFYSLAGAAAIGAYFLIRAYGSGLAAPESAGGVSAAQAAKPALDVVFHVLLALVVVIATARLFGWVCHHFKQPPVIGEIIAGIVLGPSVLGALAPQVSSFVLPDSVAPFLNVIAQLGVILYMFLVGLRMDTSILQVRGRAAVAISQVSIAVPFLLGTLLALYLYPRLSTSDVSFTGFSLFLGVSMAVTAFPVLARILTDRGIQGSYLGLMSLTCAAVGDATAWCLLALVVGVVQGNATGAGSTIVMAMIFIALMALAVRPMMVRLAKVHERTGLTQTMLSFLLVATLLSALVTDEIGIHAIFGAFALGVVIPHDTKLVRDLVHRMQDWVVVLLLPAFFAYTGMRTHIGLLGDLDAWLVCGLITLVATVGKFGGATLAARFTGAGWRESSAIGILMNTRGLMELIVLNIGYELGIISATLFTMLVIMALVTTLATAPILHFIIGRRQLTQGSVEDLGPAAMHAFESEAPTRPAREPAE